MKNINFLQRLFVWLGGFDLKTAEKCTSSETKKMTIAGSLVLIPPLVAVFSYGYAVFLVSKSIVAGAIGGCLFAAVLLLIDRSIMAYGRPGHFSFGMIGRVILAITMGFIIAEPILLKVFEDSISEQRYHKVDQAKQAITAEYDKRIYSVQAGIEKERTRLYDLQEAYTREMDGTGGSGVQNKGPIYQKKLADYRASESSFVLAQKKASEEIQQIEQAKNARFDAIERTEANGLIGRLRLLQQLGEKEPYVQWASWLLRIAFILIELLPLLLKISPSGDRNLYHKVIDIQDQEQEAVIMALSKEREQIIVKEEEIRYAQKYSELVQQEVANIANGKFKDTVHLADRLMAMAEKRIEFKSRAVKKIADEESLQQVLIQLDSIFEGFVNAVDNLTGRSNSNFSSDNI
jgi:hypothetical protein